MPNTGSYSFPPFRLDVDNGVLWRETSLVPLRPKTFAVLHHLLAHAGQVVTRSELRETIWGKTKVSAQVLRASLWELRHALDDNAAQPRFIETVPGRGWRFIGTVVSSQHSVASSKEEARDWRLETGPASPQISSLQSQVSSLVGRDPELAQLHGWLDKALGGERQMVFVTGEPGIGKTTLIDAVVAQLEANPNVWIGRGQCIEQFGEGEAYLPILEALGRIGRKAGNEQFSAFLGRYAPTWLAQLPTLIDEEKQETLQHRVQGTTRARMLRELVEAVEIFTADGSNVEPPLLVLVLEDLQWSDYSTLDLLASLARREERARLLIFGTYRPAEGLTEGHPLRAVLQELQSHAKCKELVLPPLDAEAVKDYVDRRFPNSTLPAPLAQVLHRVTDGLPFFLCAFIDDLVERNLIIHAADGWQLQGGLSAIAAVVPDNIRQLIERQIDRVEARERKILEAASIAGVEFPTAAIAASLSTSEEEVEEASAHMAARSAFLQPAGVMEWPDGTVSARYRFRHALYQQLWHEHVGIARRQRLNLRIAERVEAAYGDRVDEVATELAVYFEQGRNFARAIHYYARAAEKAIRRCAYQEAVLHLGKGLDLLATLPDKSTHAQQEFVLRLTLGISLQAIRGYGDVEVERAYASAQGLSQQTHDPEQLFRILFGLWQFHVVRAEYRRAQELSAQLLNLADTSRDVGLLVEAHGAVGVTLFHLGEIVSAYDHFERSTSLYDPEKHRTHVRIYNQDPWVACRSYSGQALWLLGYADQALQRTREAWEYARALAHPFSQAFALSDMILIYLLQGDVEKVQEEAQALLALSQEYNFPMWRMTAMERQAWAQAEIGHAENGLEIMQQAIGMRQGISAKIRIPYHKTRLAELYNKAGQPAQGLAQMQEAFALAEATEEHWWEAEMYRVKGELLLRQMALAK
jgi:DNA-binding winged helix-turn-helix (wHTH) protein/predicted ATPase